MKYCKILSLLLLSVGFAACENSADLNDRRGLDPAERCDHTVIIYMVANNNLSSFAVQNINDLERAFNADYGTRFLVLYNRPGGLNTLLDIWPDNTSAITSPVVREYATDLDVCTPEVMASVIADCRDYSPSDRYSLVLWSHATGWLPQGMHPARNVSQAEAQADVQTEVQKNAPTTYTFGADGSREMEIYELAKALPTDLKFEYIHFDACHMASVEVAHQLRHNARYLVASTAEVMAAGYPYYDGFGAMATADVGGMVREFFDLYNAYSGAMQTATLSAVDLGAMDNLAQEFQNLVQMGGNPTAVQQYGRNRGTYYNYSDLMWDLEDMAYRTWGQNAASFIAVLRDAVPHKANTPYIFQGYWNQIKVDTHCGLSVYIPRLSQPQTMQIYDRNYSWAQTTGFSSLAN